ncbi:lysozyme [Bradyrhizobium genosp. A]|uniref:lysozyme n=1 Tax=Bradyrhizobium genosp. A TaxID=83626 RepID=UPI003CEF29E8
MSVKKTAATIGSAGGIIAAAVAFTPGWEGMQAVAKRDMIGTGHPVTYCYGQTDEFGKVKVGTRFTKAECDQKLAASLPKYLAEIERCIKAPMPDKSMAAFLDASYNAGSAAVCRSPMVRLANAGDLRGACSAFAGWYVRSDGQVRRGLVARRGGDGRKGEKQLCLEGLTEGTRTVSLPEPPPAAPPKRSWWLSWIFR